MRNFNRNSGNKFGRRDSGRFGRRSSGGFNRRDSGGSGRDFERKTMHEVICDKCGQSCKVPFKPTEGKPVYCSDCFRKEESPRQESRSSYGSSRREFRPRHESSGSRQESDKLAAEFQQINAKLDKILEMLNKD